MIRVIILCFLVNTIGYSQNAILNLKYSQVVLENGQKKQTVKRTGFINVFNPAIISFTEYNENMDINIQIHEDTIYIQRQVAGTNEPFSTKFQIANDLYYLNSVTGEQQEFPYKNSLYNTTALKEKLKEKKSKTAEENGCKIETYKAKVGQKEMRLKVCSNIKIMHGKYWNDKIIKKPQNYESTNSNLHYYL